MSNRILLTSAATAALLVTISAQAAHAAPGGFLESRAPWSVSKVAGEGSRNAYCAMAKQFGQDVILTVARNMNGESSFAIDFQSPRFNISNEVDVTLDPGAGQQRSYKLLPVSSKAFVVRLGNDGPFFEAMKKTGFLRFEIADKSYSFNVADVDAGDMKLDACIASSVLPAAGESAPSIAAAPAQGVDRQALADDSSYRQEIDSLRNSIRQLEQKNEELAKNVAAAQSAPAIVPVAPPAPVVASALPQPVERSTAPVQKMPEELARLKGEGTNSRPHYNHSELESLKAENARLQKTAMEAQNAAKMESARAENARLKQQISHMEAQKRVEATPVRETVAAMTQQTTHAAAVRQGAPLPLAVVPEDIGDEQNAIAPQAGDMTEAQAQEERMIRSLQIGEGGPSRPEEKMTVRASQDPYADIPADDNFSGYSANPEGAVIEKTGERVNPETAQKDLDLQPLLPVAEKEIVQNTEERPATPLPEVVAEPAPLSQEDLVKPPVVSSRPEPVKQPEIAAAPPSQRPEPVQAMSQSADNFDTTGLTPSEIRVRRRNNQATAVQPQVVAVAPPSQMELPLEQPVPVPEVVASAPPVEKAPAPVMQEPRIQPEKMVERPLPTPEMPQPVVQAAIPAPEPVRAPAPEVYKSGVSIQNILSEAGIVNNGQQVELVSQASDSRKAAYQWKASDVYGSAVQEPLQNANAFDQQVEEYLKKTQQRCTGDFAVSADDTKEVSGRRIDSYEIACVSPGVDSSASIVFFSIDGTFTAVAHESPTAQLQTAMEIRDRLVREIAGT